jgi:hypothetical protein
MSLGQPAGSTLEKVSVETTAPQIATRGHSEAKGQNKRGCTGADFLLLCLLNF